MKHDWFSTYNLSTLDLSHNFNSSSCIMNLLHRGGENLLVNKPEGIPYNILR